MKFIPRHSLLIVLFSLSGCYKGDHADLIVYNAKIYSCDKNFTVYNAMAIRDGKILQLGPEREILNGYACDNIIDAQLRPVYPGFHDGHCHFLGYARGLMELDLKGTKSFDDLLIRIAQFNKTNEQPWIIGNGWDETLWAEDSIPNNTILNELYPNTPVFLRRIDGHTALVNQKVFDLSNLLDSVNSLDDFIQQKDGKESGIISDKAYALVSDLIPDFSDEMKLKALKKAEQNLFQAGVTSINDAGITHIERELFIKWYKNKELTIKDYAMLFPTDNNLNFASKEGVFVDHNLCIRSFKLIADGALGAEGACLLAPYSNHENHFGFMLAEEDEMRAIAELAVELGYQVNTHCIGDSANRVILNMYADVVQKIPDHRWKIEHAQVIHPNDLNLFEALRILPSVQPTHLTSDMRWAKEKIGEERMKSAYAYRTLLEKSGKIVLGTDFPVENISALETFYAAVSRRSTDGEPIGGFYPEEKLSREQALLGMTLWPAYSNFQDHKKGSLEKGKSADFVILTDDIMTIPEESILNTFVVYTYLNGRKVYDGD
jgi:predicted amidohydrolase YtcJ